MLNSAGAVAKMRGVSLMGLLIGAILVATGSLLVIGVFPTINEYLTIQRAVRKIATQVSSAQEARVAFEKQKQIEYTIATIGGEDLYITKEGDKIVISFGYNKEIPIFGPVSLLIKYQGQSK